MTRRMWSALILSLVAGCATTGQRPAAQSEPRTTVTILVSIDGFRPDYLSPQATPNLAALAKSGAVAEMRPSFPSVTFPNHYTIVTGLRPDHHGIVSNAMEDAARPGERFKLSDARQALDPFWWDGAEPIWASAEKQGVRTATMFWPGSEVPIGGTRPSDWQRFDQAVSNAQRVAAIIDWLRRPATTRPKFLTLYFDTVDTAGHKFGPDAAETRAAAGEVDVRIGDLVRELKALGQPANIIITSDHGMAQVSAARVIKIETLVPLADVNILYDGPYLALTPLTGKTAAVEAALLKPHEHMQCWLKSNVPARFAYGKHPRVPAILCLAQTGWMITSRPVEPKYLGGAHGFDNDAPEMRAIFIASGPAIAPQANLSTFDNVDVYPLLARLIGITPKASDGDPQTLAKLIAPTN
jgi:predicted AlkP superfamily pyrophosphatase or phosphodiesterase